MSFLLKFNVVICLLIIIRLITFRRGALAHNPTRSWLIYMISVACCVVIVRIVFGQYVYIDWAETLLNLILCIAIWNARGNVLSMFHKKRRSK